MIPTSQADATTQAERRAALIPAVQRYFDLMYDSDTSAFDTVVAPTVQLHGYRNGRFVMWSASMYKEILQERRSPKSLDAARRDEILLMDFTSDAMAFVKVRLRIAAQEFVDYLTWHRIDSKWLITSKGFDLEAGAASTQA
ncbi:nuclear transport factor 2 family protein [Falsiroseomonas sp. HW251]|uniref:nuclear transport factor 2 family protein n=1 Tax=Falsiroseomonas sp. HW251 TaxID=3390998 RepID=UPI003D3229EB